MASESPFLRLLIINSHQIDLNVINKLVGKLEIEIILDLNKEEDKSILRENNKLNYKHYDKEKYNNSVKKYTKFLNEETCFSETDRETIQILCFTVALQLEVKSNEILRNVIKDIYSKIENQKLDSFFVQLDNIKADAEMKTFFKPDNENVNVRNFFLKNDKWKSFVETLDGIDQTISNDEIKLMLKEKGII
jgi:hypothetical protein